MANIIGKEYTTAKVIPILMELLKDDHHEVKNNVVRGLTKIANVVREDLLNTQLLTTLGNMTKDGQWRTRMLVFELIAELAITFGKDSYVKHL